MAWLGLWLALVAGCGSAASPPQADAGGTAGAQGDAPTTGGLSPARPDAGSGPAADGGADAGGSQSQPPPGRVFPEGFLWGSAIAGFQSDMGCPSLPASQCVDENADWYAFTTSQALIDDDGTHLSGQDPARVGPGFWELYEQDIARADEELHHGSLRLSIEWSRIFPTATDGVQGFDALAAIADADAIAHYHSVFRALRARGMEPFVTLNHYSLPIWLHDPVACHEDVAGCERGGWRDKQRAVREIAKYAAFCAREFGGEVDLWATLNEPLQNMLFGYMSPSEERSHPPAVSLASDAARTVLDALIDAHARMYDAVKREDTADADGDGQSSFVGIVYPLVPVVPNNGDSLFGVDAQAAENIDYLWNRMFLNAVARGEYDEKLDGNTVMRADLAGRMDYIGVNWYFAIRVSGLGFAIPGFFSPLFTANPLDFETVPTERGQMAEYLRYVNEELGLPVIISENGTPDPDDDGTGPAYLVRNLLELHEAIDAGADVRGYYYWTLTDNYEWNHGMNERMGLYAVNAEDPSKRRTPRQTRDVFAEVARFNVLPDVLVESWAASP